MGWSLRVHMKSIPKFLKSSWDHSFPLFVPFQSRFSKHRRPGSQGQLWPAGSNSGSQVDQGKHPGLQRRPEESDHLRLGRRSIVRQPAHPLPLLRRYVCSQARDPFIIFCRGCWIYSPGFDTVRVLHQERGFQSELWDVSVVWFEGRFQLEWHTSIFDVKIQFKKREVEWDSQIQPWEQNRLLSS